MLYQLIAQRAGDPADIDGVTNTGPTAGLYSGSGGAFVVVMAQDGNEEQITFAGVPAGVFMPISIRHFVSGPADSLALYL